MQAATIQKDIKTFFGETSIHGLCFIVDEKAKWWKKILWLIVVTFSITYASITLHAIIQGKL